MTIIQLVCCRLRISVERDSSASSGFQSVALSTNLMGLKRALFKGRCFQGKGASTFAEEFSENVNLRIFPYGELAKATNNFHQDNCLGRGAFKETYYGKLRDGREIAIKRLFEGCELYFENYQIIRVLPHKNLVSICGYACHRKERLLVHEYISNGTLRDHLHNHSESKERSSLPWLTRLDIAIDIANALAFLHSDGIIHRDIKSSNVLLDENFHAKVGNLDLSRKLPGKIPYFDSHVTTAVVGTLGYLDPDYFMSHRLSLKSDVYSFGVVLCELISSQPAFDSKKKIVDFHYLVAFAIKSVKNQALDELLDPSLGFDSDHEMKQMMTAVAKFAVHCFSSSKERPSMEQVLHTLMCIRQQYVLNPMTDGDLEQNNTVATPNDDNSVKYQFQVFSHDELEEATNHFDNCLGKGGFGTVYYGKLQDGREVAVKRCHEKEEKTIQQFMKEIEISGFLRHPNLVSLYGHCSELSDRLLLVYEYVSNGTLASHLRRDLTTKIPWLTRLNIAIETATALAYLHESGIIHRDVKTTNILLDKNFQVKVGDFGISRFLPLDSSQNVPAYATHVSTAPVGTPAYIDPEYYESRRVSDKSDVYSFGVVLFELISSIPPTFMLGQQHFILAYFATTKIMNKELVQLVDPGLGFDSDSKIRESITAVAELALLCLQCPKVLRPSMKKVLETLQGIKQGT